jgi:hypothetical protein
LEYDLGIAATFIALGIPFVRVFELPDGRNAFQFRDLMPQVEEVLPTADSGDSGQHVQNAVKYLQSEIELLKGKKT